MCDPSPKTSLKAIFNNWKESDAPFQKKIKMVFKNNWLKIKRGKNCCGNYGEVGC